MTTANELLNSRIYWLTKADDAGLVKIVTTRAFDVGGNRGLDWTTLDGLRLSNRMHPTQATERLESHRDYRIGTGAEMKTIRESASAAKLSQAEIALNPPATERQLDYLAILGVEIPAGKRLTKSEASLLIDCAKNGRSGESLGSFGMFYADGSN